MGQDDLVRGLAELHHPCGLWVPPEGLGAYPDTDRSLDIVPGFVCDPDGRSAVVASTVPAWFGAQTSATLTREIQQACVDTYRSLIKEDFVGKRLDSLGTLLKERELDAILVTRPENQRYLSGFTGGDAALLISTECALLLTDFRYFEQVAEEAPDFELVKLQQKLPQVLKDKTKELGIKTLGFEASHVTYHQYQEWRRVTRGVKWTPTTDLVESLRMVKDSEELETIRSAVAISDRACDHIREFLRRGMSEKEVAWELERHMRVDGAEGIAFDLIVGSGPNGAKPHAVVSDRRIEQNEPIVLDLGARVHGYASDLTRTLCLGKPPKKLREVFDIVLRAQVAAEAQAKPGMTGQQVDAIARNVINEAGYADAFGHALGHGVGLAVHEGPPVNARDTLPLEPGMVFTIEPGIYLTGWGGVRIEDLVVMTEAGVEVLSKARKDLRAR